MAEAVFDGVRRVEGSPHLFHPSEYLCQRADIQEGVVQASKAGILEILSRGRGPDGYSCRTQSCMGIANAGRDATRQSESQDRSSDSLARHLKLPVV